MHLKVVERGPAREIYLPLLLLADDSEQQVRGYMHNGTLFVAEMDGDEIGLVLAIPNAPGIVELKAVAVDPEHQNQGAGKRMLALVLAELKRRGYERLVLGTGNSSIGQLAFYQKAGFRFWKIERDFFSPSRGYPEGLEENGIPLRDMVWLDRSI